VRIHQSRNRLGGQSEDKKADARGHRLSIFRTGNYFKNAAIAFA
jgi:hypothetical protein